MALKKKKISKRSPSKRIRLPDRKWQHWLAQYIMAGLVLEYFHQHKRLPELIDLGSLSIKELKSGDGLLSVNLQ